VERVQRGENFLLHFQFNGTDAILVDLPLASQCEVLRHYNLHSVAISDCNRKYHTKASCLGGLGNLVSQSHNFGGLALTT
jgi:hypothetical protein